MHILIAAILGIIGILWIVFQVVGVISAVMEFFVAVVNIVVGISLILCLGVATAIIGGIYFMLAQFDPVVANGFLIISVLLIILFAIFGGLSYNKKEDGIKVMNRIRFNSDKLTDDELMEFIEKSSIG